MFARDFFFVLLAVAPQGKGCGLRYDTKKGKKLHLKIYLFFKVRNISAVGVDGNEKYRNICLCRFAQAIVKNEKNTDDTEGSQTETDCD